MAMRIRGLGGDFADLLVDINTTPLIDVMLVLLIMLILTIPVQTHSLNFNTPVVRPAAALPPQAIRIDVAADGSVRWNGQLLADRKVLEDRFRAIAAELMPPEIHLWADGKSKYGQVAMVMAAAQRQGLKKFVVIGNEKFVDRELRM